MESKRKIYASMHTIIKTVLSDDLAEDIAMSATLKSYITDIFVCLQVLNYNSNNAVWE